MSYETTPQDGTNPEPEVEVIETTPEEPVETPDPIERTYTQDEWNELHGRATKAEGELKALRPKKLPASPVSSQPNVEELVLLANGMSEELVSELKAVAQVRKISLIKAQSDPIFVAVKEKFEQDKKQKDASLPAARGSGNVKVQKTFTTPGLSREEHKRLIAEAA